MSKPTFNYADPFLMDGQLTETERMVRDTAHAYAQDKLAPRVQNAFRLEHTDREILTKWARSVCWAQPSQSNTVVQV